MGKLGRTNPFGFQLGGGPSRSDQINTSFKDSVGTGGSAVDGTIEADWRRAKARGWASSLADGRAMWQTWPNTADEGGTEVFEELMRIIPPEGATLQERRDVNTQRWTQVSSAVTSDIVKDLAAIDPSIVIIDIFGNRDTVTTTEPGRAFEDADLGASDANGPAFFQFGESKCTQYPNFSQDFIMVVSYPLAAATLTKQQLSNIFATQELLNRSLPSWCQFQITTKLDPLACFELDVDHLDLTGLC